MPKDTHRTLPPTDAELVLPEQVTVALAELAGAAREGLLALAVGTGLEVLAELLAEDVDRLVGPKGRHNPDRAAVRHGSQPGQVTLGGRRVRVDRPRVRTADGTARAGAADLPGVRLDRAAGPARGGADAGQAVDPPLPGRAGAGRQPGRADRDGHLQVGGLAPVRGPRPSTPWPSCSPQDLSGLDLVALMVDGDPGGRALLCGRAGHHHRRHQGPARPWSRAPPRTPPWCASCWSGCASAAWR